MKMESPSEKMPSLINSILKVNMALIRTSEEL